MYIIVLLAFWQVFPLNERTQHGTVLFNDWQQTAVSAAQSREMHKTVPLKLLYILIYMCQILFVKISSRSSWLYLQNCC